MSPNKERFQPPNECQAIGTGIGTLMPTMPTSTRRENSRAVLPSDRICPDGSILPRNTLRKDNAFFSWDLRVSRLFDFGPRRRVEVIADLFNVTGADNFKDPAATSLLFNFDGTVRGGLGDPRQLQIGMRYLF